MTRVSIITTTFNTELTIERTIRSILSQEGSFDLEYIITEGGSTDRTVEIIKSFNDPRIKLLDARKTNQSQGINMGLRSATGDIVAFLNGDDVYHPGTIQSVVNAFLESQSMWVVGKCRIINQNDQEISKWITSYKNLLLKHYSYFFLLCDNFIPQPAVFWKREIHSEFGYFSETENLVMDYDFWLKVGRKYKPKFIDTYLADFRRFENSKSNRKFRQQFRDDMRIAFKYAKETKNYLAMPIKFFNYLRTLLIYTLIIR